VSRDSLMALLKSVILLDVMEEITANDNSVSHFSGDHNTLEDSSTDADVTGEWTFLVNISSLDCGLGGLEAEPNFFVVSDAGGRLLGEEFLGEENSVLSLESFLSL